MDDEIYHIITRTLKGNASAEDAERLKVWLNDSVQNQEAFNDFEKIWNLSGRLEMKENVDVDAEWEKFSRLSKKPQESQPSVRSLRLKIWQIAAVLVPLVFIAVFAHFYHTTNTPQQWISVQTADKVQHIVLPDGTEVLINRNSRIMYPEKFKDERTVNLKGEAYFKVFKNGRKFTVDAGRTIIEDLATEFSVNNCKPDSFTRVIVTEGKVKFSQKSDTDNNIKLVAGEKGIFDIRLSDLSKTEDIQDNSLAWVNHRLVFNNSSLDNAGKDLEDYFNVRIVIGNEIKNCLFSGTFDNPDLNNVLEVIALSTGSTVKNANNIIFLEGNACIK